MGDEDAEPDQQHGAGGGRRLLPLLLVVLALVATGMLIFTSDARWLRFGVLAALWAALIGALIAARYRKQVADRDAEMAELHVCYERELQQREPAAEIETLREELRVVRENLDAVLGAEVLVERIALHADPARLRAPEPGRRQPTVSDRRPVQGPRWPGQDTRRAVRPAAPPRDAVAGARSSGSLRAAPVAYPSAPVERTAIARTGYQVSGEPGGNNGSQTRNGHRIPLPEGRPLPAAQPGAPAQVEQPGAEPTGAHAAGTSVTELLAAHGATGATRRRRRD